MAYDLGLAARCDDFLLEHSMVSQKKMFGGIAYLLNGNMAFGIHKDHLMVRVGPDAYDALMERPETAPFDLTGRNMTGWLLVSPEGLEEETQLKSWIEKGIHFAEKLPPK